MKSCIATTIILLFSVSFCVGQFSIGAGYTLPLGAHKDLQKGAANPGYQLALSWDKELKGKFGLSSNLLIGENSVNDNSLIHKSGKWSYLTLGIGPYMEPAKNLKLRGLLTAGVYGSPSFVIDENGAVLTGFSEPINGEFRGYALSELALGFSFRVEYNIGKFYIGSNFNFSRPNFANNNDDTINIENHAITTFGIMTGFTF